MKPLYLLLLIAALCIPVRAQNPDSATATQFAVQSSSYAAKVRNFYVPKAPHFLTVDALEAIKIDSAPVAGSPQDIEDFKELKEMQDTRTKEDCARATKEAASGYESFFGDISPFSKPLPKAVDAFFKHIREDIGRAVYIEKKDYARERPFRRDPAIIPCIPLEDGFAYPSGHSALARVFAQALGDLVPARRDEFLARADRIAHDRALGGVHHPSDTVAGEALGDAVHALLLKNAIYNDELKQAAAELPASATAVPAAAAAN
jgi:acid phosphatase (class A)